MKSSMDTKPGVSADSSYLSESWWSIIGRFQIFLELRYVRELEPAAMRRNISHTQTWCVV